MEVLEYKIIDVDFFENDAILVVGDKSYYFQWQGPSSPTILDALDFMSNR